VGGTSAASAVGGSNGSNGGNGVNGSGFGGGGAVVQVPFWRTPDQHAHLSSEALHSKLQNELRELDAGA
jgi:hypothetical protein